MEHHAYISALCYCKHAKWDIRRTLREEVDALRPEANCIKIGEKKPRKKTRPGRKSWDNPRNAQPAVTTVLF